MNFTEFLLHVPFSYMGTLKRIAGNPSTVIDLGCGDGKIMEIIGDKSWDVTGIDVYSDSLKQAKATGMYTTLIKGDLVTTVKKLIKEKKKYDLVFCSQVIEHITREDGEELLSLVDKLAKKRIYFGTPNGFMHQPEVFIKGNPHQHHKSGWSLDDFRKYGYKVNGVGFKPVWSEDGVGRTNNKVLEFIITIIAFAFNPVVYYFPDLAAGILAVKDIKNGTKR